MLKNALEIMSSDWESEQERKMERWLRWRRYRRQLPKQGLYYTRALKDRADLYAIKRRINALREKIMSHLLELFPDTHGEQAQVARLLAMEFYAPTYESEIKQQTRREMILILERYEAYLNTDEVFEEYKKEKLRSEEKQNEKSNEKDFQNIKSLLEHKLGRFKAGKGDIPREILKQAIILHELENPNLYKEFRKREDAEIALNCQKKKGDGAYAEWEKLTAKMPFSYSKFPHIQTLQEEQYGIYVKEKREEAGAEDFPSQRREKDDVLSDLREMGKSLGLLP